MLVKLNLFCYSFRICQYLWYCLWENGWVSCWKESIRLWTCVSCSVSNAELASRKLVLWFIHWNLLFLTLGFDFYKCTLNQLVLREICPFVGSVNAFQQKSSKMFEVNNESTRSASETCSVSNGHQNNDNDVTIFLMSLL